MEVSDYIGQAWKAVSDAKVPEPLQELAFREALEFLRTSASASDKGGRSGPKGGSREADSEKGSGNPAVPTFDEFVQELATQSGAGVEDLKHLFSLDQEGSVHLRPPGRQFGSSKSNKCLRIATLIVPATAVLTKKQTIPADIVRNECKSKSCFDAGNFAATMGQLKGITYGGSGSKRTFVLGGDWESYFRSAVDATQRPDSE